MQAGDVKIPPRFVVDIRPTAGLPFVFFFTGELGLRIFWLCTAPLCTERGVWVFIMRQSISEL